MTKPAESPGGQRLLSLDRRNFLKSATLATASPIILAAAPADAREAKAGRSGAVARLLAVPAQHRDVDWIRQSLQVAVELELSTIPPYLCAWWSIRDRSGESARLISGVISDEMYHMGLVCNLLVAVGGTPRIADVGLSYPGPLPGGVRDGLTVYLSGLTREYVHDVLMGIEEPEAPLARQATVPSIGAFYSALLTAFQDVRPGLTTQGQLTRRIGPDSLLLVESLDDVEQAIGTIKEQGEGTTASPDASAEDETPAHYYAFGEIYHEHRVQQVDGVWEFSGDPVPFPDARPMGVVPAGGWPSPATDVQELLQQFDETFSNVLQHLDDAWAAGDPDALDDAVRAMRALEDPALQLMDVPLPDGGGGTYGPQFRVLPRAGQAAKRRR